LRAFFDKAAERLRGDEGPLLRTTKGGCARTSAPPLSV
jgi:hypothetical protein